MRWKALAVVALLVVGGVAILFAVTGGPASRAATDSQYLTAAATTTDVQQAVVANGTLERATTYLLNFGTDPAVQTGSSTSGGSGTTTWKVKAVNVKEGDAVSNGDALATGDTADLQNELSVARSSRTTATIQLAIANDQLDAASTTDQKRQARIAVQNAKSQLTQAKSQVADLEAQIARATIVAPAGGTITEVSVVAGTTAGSGDAIVMTSGPLQVTASYAETDLPSIKIGQAASVTISAIDATVDGTVVAVAPSATSSGSSSVVTYAVTIELGTAPSAARPGMSTEVSVTTAQANGVLAVPSVALVGQTGSYHVVVVGSDGTTQNRDVTVGLVTDILAEIQSGLHEGERVVIGTVSARNQTTTGGFGFPGGGQRINGGGGGGGGGGGTTVPAQPGGQP